MNRLVVFQDILGFKNIIQNNSSASVGNKFTNICGNTLPALNKPFQFPHNEPTLFPNRSPQKNWCIRHAFSDSIILISHDDSYENCLALLIYAYRSTQLLMASGYVVRGGGAFGDMYVDTNNSIFLGKALTSAYELEQRQDWAGIALNESVETNLPDIFATSTKYSSYLKCLFPNYQVPMKNGNVVQYRTINWRWNLIVQLGTASLFTQTNQWGEKRKIDNTLEYCSFIRNNNFDYPSTNSASLVPIEIREFQVSGGNIPPPFIHGDKY